MEKIKIGKIVNAVALRGEVKVYSYSDRKERYEALKEILVEQKKGFTPYEIQNVRYQKNIVILKLRGVDDRNAAEARHRGTESCNARADGAAAEVRRGVLHARRPRDRGAGEQGGVF